jgi:hypothetical protein
MSDLAMVKKALPLFPQMLQEDLRLIRLKCAEKLESIKGVRNRATLEKAIAECDRLVNANDN